LLVALADNMETKSDAITNETRILWKNAIFFSNFHIASLTKNRSTI